jgi:hypothetical protein
MSTTTALECGYSNFVLLRTSAFVRRFPALLATIVNPLFSTIRGVRNAPRGDQNTSGRWAIWFVVKCLLSAPGDLCSIYSFNVVKVHSPCPSLELLHVFRQGFWVPFWNTSLRQGLSSLISAEVGPALLVKCGCFSEVILGCFWEVFVFREIVSWFLIVFFGRVLFDFLWFFERVTAVEFNWRLLDDGGRLSIFGVG